MKQKTSRKLALNKQKVSNLSKGEMRQVQGGTGFCGVIVATTACATDFTRPIYYSIGCGSDFTRPVSLVTR
jgi:hypothetical protein